MSYWKYIWKKYDNGGVARAWIIIGIITLIVCVWMVIYMYNHDIDNNILDNSNIIIEDISSDSTTSAPTTTDYDNLPVLRTSKIINASTVNVRSSATGKSNTNIIGHLNNGDYIHIVGYTPNEWCRIKYKDTYGYVYSEFVDFSHDYANEIISTDLLPTDVIGFDYISEEYLYETMSFVAPKLISTIDAIMYNYVTYNIKPSFQLAVMCVESEYGSSDLAVYKNNVCGLNAFSTETQSMYDNAYEFESMSDCVLTFGEIIHESYISQGYTSIEKISTKYCPGNSRTWRDLVKDVQDRIDFIYDGCE